MTRDDLREALQSGQMQAWMHVIGGGETSSELTDRDFRAVYGGGLFTDYSRHPFDGIPTTRGGKACGFAQFLGTTWKGLRERFGFTGFTPQEQLEGATALVMDAGAWPFIEHGDLETAIAKLANTWVSLPGLGTAKAERIFVKWGGVLPVTDYSAAPKAAPEPTQGTVAQETPEAAPAIANPEGAMPLLVALLPAVLSLFAPRAQAQLEKITGASPEIVGQFAQSVIGKVQELTGKPDPVQAVAALTADPKPELVQQVEEHALDHLDKLMPVLDKLNEYDRAARADELTARDAASKRAALDRWDMTPWLVGFAGGTSTVLVVGLLAVIIAQSLTGDKEINTALVGLAGPLLAISMGVWREVFAYRFASTPDSAAKDAVIGELAKK